MQFLLGQKKHLWVPSISPPFLPLLLEFGPQIIHSKPDTLIFLSLFPLSGAEAFQFVDKLGHFFRVLEFLNLWKHLGLMGKES